MTEHHFSSLAEDLLTWLAASDDNTSVDDYVQAVEKGWQLQKAKWADTQKNTKPGDPYHDLPDPLIGLGPYYNGTEDWAAAQAELEHAGMITTAAGSSNLAITDAGRAWVRRRRDDAGKARDQTTRPTATVHDLDGQPLDRDAYAAQLRGRADTDRLSPRLELLREGEATTIAALLDELAGVYPDEDLGRLAREMAVLIYDRLGI